MIVSKEIAHLKHLLHLSVHLLIIYEGEFLCRQRSENELRYQGLLTTTIGTHVELNCNYLQTLKKYFNKNNLNLVGEFSVNDEFENEICALYTYQIKENQLSKKFTQDKIFLSNNKLEELIKKNKTTPHLKEAYELYMLKNN